jgi:hypothetical protein
MSLPLHPSWSTNAISLSIYLSIYALQPLWTLAAFFQFPNLYTVGRTPWTGDQPVARPLPTHRTIQTQNKRTQTFMSLAGFEPTIPAFERVKTVHAFDRATTVISRTDSNNIKYLGVQYELHLLIYFHIGQGIS